MDQDERIIQLEIKVAHQEHLLEELSGVLHRQQATIDLLEKKIGIITERVKEGAGLDVGPHNQKPPHY